MNGTSRQWQLLSHVFGGEASTSEPAPAEPAVHKLMRLVRSFFHYFGGKGAPRVAITGNGVAWGMGAIEIVPELTFRRLMGELLKRRPVVFINVHGERGLLGELGFDRNLPLTSLLNGNECLTLSGQRNGQRVFAHVGGGEMGRASVHRHAQSISRAREAVAGTPLLQKVASPITQFDRGEISVFVQSFLEGKPAGDAEDIRQLLRKASSILRQIHAATASRTILPEDELLAKMERDLHLIEDGDAQNMVSQLIGQTRAWIAMRKPSAVLTHGDFTLANVLFDAQGNVCGIIDWEWVRDRGCAGFDAINLAVTATAHREKRSFSSVACELLAGGGPGPALDFLGETLPSLDMTPADIPGLAKLFWLDLIFRGGIWTEPANKDWWPEMLRPMRDIRAAH